MSRLEGELSFHHHYTLYAGSRDTRRWYEFIITKKMQSTSFTTSGFLRFIIKHELVTSQKPHGKKNTKHSA